MGRKTEGGVIKGAGVKYDEQNTDIRISIKPEVTCSGATLP